MALARPLADYLAVQPFDDTPDSPILQPLRRGVKFRRGRVLAAGPRATIAPGTVVWYEAHSAHPGQTCPLDAALFGGDEGAWAFLIRAPRTSAPSSHEDDLETERTEAEIERLQADWRGTPEERIPREIRYSMSRLKRRLAALEEGRVFKRRSSRLGHTSDTAVREGIFAVETP